MMLLFSVS